MNTYKITYLNLDDNEIVVYEDAHTPIDAMRIVYAYETDVALSIIKVKLIKDKPFKPVTHKYRAVLEVPCTSEDHLRRYLASMRIRAKEIVSITKI